MKRKMIRVMGVMMIVLLTAGCGKSDGTSGGSPTRTETMGTEAGTDAAASKTATETENGKSGAEQSTEISLSEEEAVKLALEKVPQASKDNIRIHLDYENGKPVYEGSIVYKGVEYDFEIDAATGTILEWEQER